MRNRHNAGEGEGARGSISRCCRGSAAAAGGDIPCVTPNEGRFHPTRRLLPPTRLQAKPPGVIQPQGAHCLIPSTSIAAWKTRRQKIPPLRQSICVQECISYLSCLPKGKAIRRFTARNKVESAAVRDIGEASVYLGVYSRARRVDYF